MKKKIITAFGVFGVVAVAAAVFVFKPWLLFVDVEVNDEIPMVASSAPATSTAPAVETGAVGETGASQSGQEQTPAAPVIVRSGAFTSHEHSTSGTASIFQLPGGAHQLVLENLETSNGPDVHVWLSAGPVVEGRAGWFTAKDHAHYDLGAIKGNRGNQVYEIPADVSVADWSSVVLWCEDFSVSFGAAPLA